MINKHAAYYQQVVARRRPLWWAVCGLSVLAAWAQLVIVTNGWWPVAWMLPASGLVVVKAARMRAVKGRRVRAYTRIFDLRNGSWGFMAQFVLLAPANCIAAYHWKQLPARSHFGWLANTYHHWYWPAGMLVVGAIATTAVRLGERANYHPAEYHAPDKIWHDIYAHMIAITGSLLIGVTIVLWASSSVWWSWTVVALIIGWILAGQADLLRFKRRPHLRRGLHQQCGSHGRVLVMPVDSGDTAQQYFAWIRDNRRGQSWTADPPNKPG